ncbi:ABC transporter substrate-binding protein [Roseomonas sp. PWR1]|uniref:ABC transporter substrate-binding protein n=1 Tax=Roseomonas nitratireducens TaxID=2820810 RepID=A0ABS4AQ53_9PROT|nr:ABC transporter substrate-binding protein [Neoroseomonas nitratireducens]MBP0463485.1 ABC transporter substrate-binding protein [Neoroseomonas nitratireducens]
MQRPDRQPRLPARRALLAALAAAPALPLHAQTLAARPLRIGYIVNGPERTIFEEKFELGMRENGYVVGRNLTIDYRHQLRPDHDLSDVMRSFVEARVDAIVCSTRGGVLAARAATTTIPIVFGATRDAIQDGLVQSLARPEGNVTGQSFHAGELTAKRIQLMREAFPEARRFAVIFNIYYPSQIQIDEAERAQAALGIELVFQGIAVPEGLEDAFADLRRRGIAALFVVSDVSTITSRVRLGETALRHRIPMVMSNKRYLTGGALMSYGPDISEGFRRAARQVVRAANGTPISFLPVENPTHFEFVIDLRAARTLGVEITQPMLARADDVIE